MPHVEIPPLIQRAGADEAAGQVPLPALPHEVLGGHRLHEQPLHAYRAVGAERRRSQEFPEGLEVVVEKGIGLRRMPTGKGSEDGGKRGDDSMGVGVIVSVHDLTSRFTESDDLRDGGDFSW